MYHSRTHRNSYHRTSTDRRTSRSDKHFVPQMESVNVWNVKEGVLQVESLPKAEASSEENLEPGIVAVLDVINGNSIRRLLPKCYCFSSANTSSSDKNYRTGRRDRIMRRRDSETRYLSKQRATYYWDELRKSKDSHIDERAESENRKKFLFEKLDKNLQSVLKCSNCFDYAIPNPLICVKNHVICNACAEECRGICATQVDQHSQCMFKLKAASDLTVKFARECQFKCTRPGCDELLLYDDYEDHRSRYHTKSKRPERKSDSSTESLYDFGGEPIRSKSSLNIIPAGAEKDVAVVGKLCN